MAEKKLVQSTLTGLFRRPAPMYKDASNLYEEFVEAYNRRHAGSLSNRREVLEEAQREWRALRDAGSGGGESAARAFIEEVAKWEAERAKDGERKGWITKSMSRTSDRAESQAITAGSSASVGPSRDNGNSDQLSGAVKRAAPGLLRSSEEEQRCLEHFISVVVGIEPSELLQDDVLTQEVFMSALVKVAGAWSQYETTVSVYQAHIASKLAWARKESLVLDAQHAVDAICERVKNQLQQISLIKINPAYILRPSCHASAIQKAALLSDCLVPFERSSVEIMNAVRRLEKRNEQVRSRLGKGILHELRAEDVSMRVTNDTSLTWSDAVDNITEAQSLGKDAHGPMPSSVLLAIADDLQETNAVSLKRLLAAMEDLFSGSNLHLRTLACSCANQLLYWLPLMLLTHANCVLLVNIHEFSLVAEHDTLLELLTMDDAASSHTTDKSRGDEQMTAVSSKKAPKDPVMNYVREKPGRKARHVEFPGIATEAVAFMQQHGFAAQARRRSDTATSSGVTLKALREHLLNNITGLREKGISRTTVHQLMEPPRRKTKNANRYLGVIKARIPAKANDHSIADHLHTHFCFAQVNLVMELVAEHCGTCVAISCDDMNKVHVGTLAVSRYHQLRRFFLNGDQPHYPDHDFPLQNSKIVPSGYMVLSFARPASVVEREHLGVTVTCHAMDDNMDSTTPSTGADSRHGSASTVKSSLPILRVRSHSWCKSSTRNPPSTRARHRSLSPPARREPTQSDPCQRGRRFVRDRLGRLHYWWPRTGPVYIKTRACKFASSSACTHAHDLMSVVKEQMQQGKTCVALCVDGGPDWNIRSLPVFVELGRLWRDTQLDALIATSYAPQQSRYNPVERQWSPRAKDLAAVTLSAVLPGETLPPDQQKLSDEECKRKQAVVFDLAMDHLITYWNGRVYDGYPVKAEKEACLGLEQEVNSDRHNRISKLASAGVKALESDPQLTELRKELAFLAEHADRRTYLLMFSKCTKPACQHCKVHPTVAKDVVNIIRNTPGVLSPQPCQQFPGHYASYLQACFRAMAGLKQPHPDDHLPQRHGQQVARCDKDGCHYVLQSAADADRHRRLVHWPEKGPATGGATYPCHFQEESGLVCNLVFQSNYQRQKHKKEAGHAQRRGRPAKK